MAWPSHEASVLSTPLILGVGGTQRPGSSSERMLRRALEFAAAAGARTRLLCGVDVLMPMYSPEVPERSAEAKSFATAIREADGLILASPGYHGSLSGLVKNALDYIEDLRADERPYLHGRAVGCIAVGAGWQATGSTLAALRSIVHALRGWPTPIGVCVNSLAPTDLADSALEEQLRQMTSQVLDFALMNAAWRRSTQRPERNVDASRRQQTC